MNLKIPVRIEAPGEPGQVASWVSASTRRRQKAASCILSLDITIIIRRLANMP
jgi:hypothetical protein